MIRIGDRVSPKPETYPEKGRGKMCKVIYVSEDGEMVSVRIPRIAGVYSYPVRDVLVQAKLKL